MDQNVHAERTRDPLDKQIIALSVNSQWWRKPCRKSHTNHHADREDEHRDHGVQGRKHFAGDPHDTLKQRERYNEQASQIASLANYHGQTTALRIEPTVGGIVQRQITSPTNRPVEFRPQ
jgi:hypothetical protein